MSSPAGGRALATFRTGWRERKLCSKTDDSGARVLEHELAQLPRGRTAKAVNSLRFIAYDSEAEPIWSERSYYVDLKAVDVLVLVDQYIIEALGETTSPSVLGDQRTPIEQKVVEVEQGGLCAFGS